MRIKINNKMLIPKKGKNLPINIPVLFYTSRVQAIDKKSIKQNKVIAINYYNTQKTIAVPFYKPISRLVSLT